MSPCICSGGVQRNSIRTAIEDAGFVSTTASPGPSRLDVVMWHAASGRQERCPSITGQTAVYTILGLNFEGRKKVLV